MRILLLLLFTPVVHADAWTDVLKQAGLTREQVHFDALDLQQGGVGLYPGPFFTAAQGAPLRIPYYARTYRDVLLSYAKEPFNALTSGLARVGLGVRRTLEADPLQPIEAFSKQKDALAAAVTHLHKLGGKPVTAAQKKELTKKAALLSADGAQILAYLLETEAHAMEWRQRAFATLDRAFLSRAFAQRLQAPKREDQEDHNGSTPELRRLLREVDLPVLMAGGLDLTLGVQRAREKLPAALKATDRFDWETPLGWIRVRGDTTNDTYPDKPYLLTVDAGGDDTYFGGGGTYDVNRPVSVLIDLAGNDKYLVKAGLADANAEIERRQASGTPLFGSGLFGYGILVDVLGNDTYRAYRHAEGSGDFGLGLLFDLSGDDVYDVWTQGQGAAEFGGGALIDLAGNDQYQATFAAQGFGGPLGTGLLIDTGDGNDQYLAQETRIDFPSEVDRKHNVSFTQGAAFGVRADGTDGFGLAGGFGALVDEGGDNTFQSGFFAQGIAYWYGVGFLSTGEGKDTFSAGKYAQGAATHFGVGILYDRGGNDTYRVEQELGIGHGHDFGVGFLLDDAGNDRYDAPNFSLGCASAQGLGFFWDRAGDDAYKTRAPETLGCADLRIDLPSLRLTSRTLGVFLDTGGKNTFETPKWDFKNEREWVSKKMDLPEWVPARARRTLIGVGRQVNEPTTEEPL